MTTGCWVLLMVIMMINMTGANYMTDSPHASEPRDCSEILKSDERSDGVYTVYIGSKNRSIEVYCDMTTDGGGWTVFQRRKDGSLNFNRNWNYYKTGFGSPVGEFYPNKGSNVNHCTTQLRHCLYST